MPILVIDGHRYPLPATQKAIRLLADDGTTELFAVETTAGNVAAGKVAAVGAVTAPSIDGAAPTGAGLTIGAAGTSKIGFYGHAVTAQQTGVAVDAAGIHAALVALGLITA